MLPLMVLLLGLASPLAAQQSVSSAGETIDVSLVNVDVFVTDKKGRRVTGLTAADFEILENGRVQPITNFAEYAGGDKAAGAPQATPAPAAKRTIVVFVERFSLPGFRTKPMFDALRKTLRGAVRPGDSASVIFWDNASAYTLQDFTDDVPSLEAALTEVEHQSTGVAGSYDFLQKQAALVEAYFDSLPPERAAGRTAGDSMTRWDLQSNAEFGLFRMRMKAMELQAIMRSISDEDGRKIVLFATNNFGVFPRGVEALAATPSSVGSNWRTDNFRHAVARTANEHGITIYPIYPVGLAWRPTASATENRADIFAIDPVADATRSSRDFSAVVNQTTALEELAKETGGLMASGSDDVVELLPHIVEDLSNYYSLAYRTPATGTTKSRDIVVKAKNRNYQVRSRREYVEKTDVTRMQDRVIANLYRSDNVGAIPVTVDFGAIEKKSRTRWSVPLKIHVPIDALSSLNGGEGAFSVFVATGGVIGVMSDVEQRTQELRAADIPPGLKELTYEFTLTFSGATSVVSVGVLDERTKEYGLETVELPAYRAEDRVGGE
ncbi:MAG TPA: VWA domain-containing protein [Thermoanaerobaculia bacterium]